MSWDSRFAEPIQLPDGIKLASLRESIAHLVKLSPPQSDACRPCSRRPSTASGPVGFVRIATLQALNRHAFRVFNPDQKEPHWELPKLNRDTA